MTTLTVAPTAEEATELAAERIAAVIDAQDSCHIALAGGNTPRPAYELLAARVSDWGGVELWLGDERMVPLDSPDSNFRMVSETLLDGIEREPLPRIHAVSTASEPERAADRYAQLLRSHLPGDQPRLSIALLGLGEDAHTASLFPRAPALRERNRLCVAVHGSPKPPPDRVTFTLPVFDVAAQLLILATGEGKAQAVASTLAEPDESAPASLITRARLELIIDEAAAAAVPAEERA
jgi:6-phosphogluconolactonase